MEKVPVLFIIFNRPEIAKSSFEAIREYKPTELYIAADGPRESRAGERELCELTRKSIIDMIDWDCNVHKLFRDKNIGVDFGVYKAINWMFEREQWGVIIEDDCYVSQDFFALCEDAFPRFKNVPKVAHIVANNPMSKLQKSSDICFTYHAISWGWGTWRDKWEAIMDVEMKDFPSYTVSKFIKRFGLFQGLMYKRAFRHTYLNRDKLKTWDTIWRFSILQSNSLCLLPMVNLAKNNGIGTCEGSHYEIGEEDFYSYVQLGRLIKPYHYQDELIITEEISKLENRQYKRLRMFGLNKKLKRLFHI